MLETIFIIMIGMGSVAFITLLERKILGLSQVRLGPNKVSVFGLLQPVMDGVKLLMKVIVSPLTKQWLLFLGMPMMLLLIFMLMWSTVLVWHGAYCYLKMSSLLFFSLLGLSSYSIILTGWSSTSSFSKLGSLRSMLQSLSYEVALILIFIYSLLLMKSMSFISLLSSFELLIFWSALWITISLIESNRAPFDLLEGESELISGFNVEMPSLTFVYLFLSEYGMLLVLAMMAEIILMQNISTISLIVVMLFLFLRSCFPRIRYDLMMTLMWQMILPIGVFLSFMGFFIFELSGFHIWFRIKI